MLPPGAAASTVSTEGRMWKEGRRDRLKETNNNNSSNSSNSNSKDRTHTEDGDTWAKRRALHQKLDPWGRSSLHSLMQKAVFFLPRFSHKKTRKASRPKTNKQHLPHTSLTSQMVEVV